jgi:hypothetical protein
MSFPELAEVFHGFPSTEQPGIPEGQRRMERVGYEYTYHTGITDWSLQMQETQLRTTIIQCNTTATTRDWVQSITRNDIRAAGRAA